MANKSAATIIPLDPYRLRSSAEQRTAAMGRHPSMRARLGRDDNALARDNEAAVREIDARRRPVAVSAEENDEPSELARPTVAVAEFARRRLTGDYTVDEFGFDPHFTDAVVLPLLRALATAWFRVNVTGIENLPDTGAALVVANHAGVLPIDAMMTTVAVHDNHPAQRPLRLLAGDTVFDTPVLGRAARKAGHTRACTADAHRLLSTGELTAVFPEGYKGLGKRYKDRYKLQRFGRGGFVSAALRTKAPIIPCSIVGSEEIYPMIGDIRVLARLLGLPYFPITPLFPLTGLIGLIPLPSKWHIEFGEPIPTADFDDRAADDPTVAFEIADHPRETIQQTLYRLLRHRHDHIPK